MSAQSQRTREQLAAEYSMLAQLAEEMQKEITLVQNLIAEIDTASRTLKHIGELEEEKEVLIPIASGIYARATMKKQEKFLVSIGSNVLVEKTLEQTLDFLKNQREELQKHLSRRLEELNRIAARIEEIRKTLTGR
ncbi:MAG: prefoldin subunit alpha [Thermoprotei archaeon]|nr:MAG: prefoldin subunit alpha [Thermoprotei archaeon]